MKCTKCGNFMPRVIIGNVIDYRHPGITECPSKPVVSHVDVADSWEPSARHYRDIEVAR